MHNQTLDANDSRCHLKPERSHACATKSVIKFPRSAWVSPKIDILRMIRATFLFCPGYIYPPISVRFRCTQRPFFLVEYTLTHTDNVYWFFFTCTFHFIFWWVYESKCKQHISSIGVNAYPTKLQPLYIAQPKTHINTTTITKTTRNCWMLLVVLSIVQSQKVKLNTKPLN